MVRGLHPVRAFRELTEFAQQFLILLAAILIGAAVAWSRQIYLNPRHTFEGMLRNNLSTTSVTKHIHTADSGQTVDQYVQLSFASPVAARNVVQVKQTGGDIKSTVKTETIGTLSADYSRYLEISTTQQAASGQPADFSKVENIWGKNDQLATTHYLRQANLGLIPFGNVSGGDTDVLINALLNSYQVDYRSVTMKVVNGRQVWVYSVKVDMDKYIAVLKRISKAVGLGDQPDLNAEVYKDQPDIAVNVAVDKASRQLVQLTYAATKETEDYSAYGLDRPVQLPTQTIPFTELQDRLQQIPQ